MFTLAGVAQDGQQLQRMALEFWPASSIIEQANEIFCHVKVERRQIIHLFEFLIGWLFRSVVLVVWVVFSSTGGLEYILIGEKGKNNFKGTTINHATRSEAEIFVSTKRLLDSPKRLEGTNNN